MMKEFKEFWMECGLTIISIGVLLLLILFIIFSGISKYEAYKFTEITGIDSQCTITGDFYVKHNNKWIPYSIWEQSEINKHYEVKLNKEK